MAAFGVTTATISIVLSVFMGGLALGSWLAGQMSSRFGTVSAPRALRFYAFAELLIALSSVCVPYLLRTGQGLLSGVGGNIQWASWDYHVVSGFCIAAALVPFCIAMGATFPLAMYSIQRSALPDSERSFSYLYLANVLGAATGTIVSALFLIELVGFRRTLFVAGALNLLVAAAATALSFRIERAPVTAVQPPGPAEALNTLFVGNSLLALLFLSGLTSMAFEVVWVRQFTPFLGTVVYAFATILTIYLLATFLGSVIYRRWSSSGSPRVDRRWVGAVWFAAGCFALLPLIGADPRLGVAPIPVIRALSVGRVIIGIAPFCVAVGFLTPALVDRWSSGNPRRAGSAYAVNVVGCIIGPLVASFFLLPWIGERKTLLVLSALLLAVGVIAIATRGSHSSSERSGQVGPVAVMSAFAAGIVLIVTLTRDFESVFANSVVRRDATATVIATGEGRNKHLLVNGSGMTALVTITKIIAHLPLAISKERPKNVLVICFGMGTSFRSATTWGIPVTAVELVPAVPGLFGYYHEDAADVLQRTGARIVIDDGRRFLERTREVYDVITVDPPPPTEAAGTSLLYSREFYAAARRRLRSGGILQQWFPPTTERTLVSAVARSIKDSFPHVRVFGAYDLWGLHFIASDRPIPQVTADELADRMPPVAARDIVEWETGYIPAGIFSILLQQEVPVETLIALDPNAPALTDDRPVNEYYFLRRGKSFELMLPEASQQMEERK